MFAEEDAIYRYKYLPFNDGSLEVIKSGTIKFTSPLDFNDPFDSIPLLDLDAIDNLPKSRPDLLKKAGNRLGLSPAKRLQQKHKILANFKRSVQNGEFFKTLLDGIGILSLSKRPLDILMWSHYAEYHRGFVIEFRIPIMGSHAEAKLSEEWLVPLEVAYADERPTVYYGADSNDDVFQKTILTKSKHWEYEQEERVMERKRGSGIHTYRRDEVLCSVIAGMKAPVSTIQKLQAAIDGLPDTMVNKVTLYQAKASTSKYGLIVDGHPRM